MKTRPIARPIALLILLAVLASLPACGFLRDEFWTLAPPVRALDDEAASMRDR